MTSRFRISLSVAIVLSLGFSALPVFASGVNYIQHNLVSDLPGMANFTDPHLVNPWGMSSSTGSPWWVSDNGTGLSTLYNGNTGTPQALVVTIPPSPSAPTGQVFNATPSFKIGGVSKALFIFATEDGTIAAWNGAQGTTAVTEVDNSPSEAIYKGIAIGSVGSNDFLYAADFHGGKIDVFDGNFGSVNIPGGFTDPNLPAGFAPFNIQNLGGKLYVTYAMQDADKEDDVAGPGLGFVDVFDTAGVLQERLVSNGVLNSPWGLAIAPSNFGIFSNALLIGNFGDGTINAFDPNAPNTYLGTLTQFGSPITIEGLWGLGFGNGANAGPKTSLFFTAGIAGPDNIEDHGLFGVITSAPEPSAVSLTICSAIGLLVLARRRRVEE